MKRYFQCAEQQDSPRNLTKYCACHAILHCQILEKFTGNSWSGISNAQPIREWSETVPTQKTQNWTRRAAKATCRTRQEQILLKITTFPAPPIIPNFTTCCACHKKWHMNFTNAVPATKSDTCTSPNAIPATKSKIWTSPNTAPVTKSDT